MAIKTYKKTSRTKLSDNFVVSEFACKGSGCCETVKIDTALVEIVQKIRSHFGAAVNINSGYRCATHNKRVGGASGSYHTKGMAADIAVQGVAPAEVAKYAESIGVLGIGLYETPQDGYFVHVDTRTSKSFWYGQGQAYRSTFGGEVKQDAAYTQEQFIRDVQKACGAAVDGIAGPETLSKTVTLSAKTNAAHGAVKAVQKYLYALGYTEVGDADGEAGPMFTSAVEHFQKDNGYKADGEITAKCKTWRKLLGLNEEDAFEEYMVRVSISNLYIRKGAGTNYKTNGMIKPGSYTIVAESSGQGSTKGWGKLKSGAGWIALDYCKRV